MRTTRQITTTAAGLILGSVSAVTAVAQSPVIVEDGAVVGSSQATGATDLFYNYYTQGYSNRANAAAYVSPVPVPPNVGHTFYTYQPLYPDEMLYWHAQRYHNYYDGGAGLNRTKAMYYAPPVRTGLNYVYRKIQLPRP